VRVLGWLVVVGAGCATTSACPPGARLATAEPPGGRIEWCQIAPDDLAPVSGRTSPVVLDVTAPGANSTPPGLAFVSTASRPRPDPPGMSRPAASTSGMLGPFTHWYPNGAVESHGSYVDDGTTSVPDGVWSFWYPDGSPKGIGRYDRGKPVGCFSTRDEMGTEVTSIAHGDGFVAERCMPPTDAMTSLVEARSHPRDARSVWGDLSFDAGARSGFGESNPSLYSFDPLAELFGVTLRKQLGAFRVGGRARVRLSPDDNVRAYEAGGVVAYAIPLPFQRLGVEAESELGVESLSVDTPCAGLSADRQVSFWTPVAGARLATWYAITPSFAVVAGAGVDGWLARPVCPTSSCNPGEAWTLGGVAFGVDVGLRLTLR
jgi:hypothetical protein